MNIKIYISDLDVFGGTHKSAVILSEYLMKQGHEIEIITNNFVPEKTYSLFSKMKVTVIGGDKMFKAAGLVGLLKRRCSRFLFSMKLLRGDVDVINIHDYGFERDIICLRVASLFFRKKVKLVWQINDLSCVFCVGVHKNRKKRFGDFRGRWIEILAGKFVDVITVNVQKNQARVKTYMKCDSMVVYPGVDFGTILPEECFDRQISLPCNIHLFSIGVMFTYRNYETIIRVQKRLNEKNISSRCHVAGRTDTNPDTVKYAKRLEEMAQEHGVDFQLLGQITSEQMQVEYAATHIFMFINIDQSWGLAVFEAMARGVPVILSKSVGAVEILTDKRGVCMVDPENVEEISQAISYLMNPNHYAEQSRFAREAVKNMTYDKMYNERIERLFYDLK